MLGWRLITDYLLAAIRPPDPEFVRVITLQATYAQTDTLQATYAQTITLSARII